MSHVAYPTDTDIKDRCNNLGMFSGVASGTQTALCSGKSVAIIAEWERRVGWNPFLSTGLDEIRIYDPPGGRGRYGQGPGVQMGGDKLMFLQTGIITLTSLLINYSPTYAGDTKTVETDFMLEPYFTTPKTRIRFFWQLTGAPKSIKITAKWGYSLTVPDDVWEGLVMYGVFLVAKQFILQYTQQPAEWSEGDVRERMDAGTLGMYADAEKSPGIVDFRRLCQAYMFPEI